MNELHKGFEAWLEAEFGMWAIPVNGKYKSRQTQAMWEAWQAALQSQTAPAVPEGWKLVPIEPTEEMRKRAGLSRGADFYTISKVWHAMLTAAPQPDHIGDANKRGEVLRQLVDELSIVNESEGVAGYHLNGDVLMWGQTEIPGLLEEARILLADHSPDDRKVEPPTWTAEEEPVAYLTWQQVRHAIDDWEEVVALSHKSDVSADGTPAFPVYTHPAESREEIQAQALDDFAGDIDSRVAEWRAAKESALYRSIIEGQEWSDRARLKAARLRASQQEGGDDSEKN